MLVAALGFALAISAALPTACTPPPGAKAFLASVRTPIVWVGEMHGTSDQPGLFGDLVCAAAQTGRPVFVVLERDVAGEAAWDTFLKSRGDPGAEAEFLKSGEWTTSAREDGRSTPAMLALAQTLRRAFQDHLILGVRLMLRDLPPETSRDAYEAAMAQVVDDAANTHPGAIVLAYSGNTHAMKGSVTIGDETYRFAAAHLGPSKVTSILLASNAGSAWNCHSDGCGPHPYDAKPHTRGLFPSEAPQGYDAIAYTGLSTVASPPVAELLTPTTLAR